MERTDEVEFRLAVVNRDEAKGDHKAVLIHVEALCRVMHAHICRYLKEAGCEDDKKFGIGASAIANLLTAWIQGAAIDPRQALELTIKGMRINLRKNLAGADSREGS